MIILKDLNLKSKLKWMMIFNLIQMMKLKKYFSYINLKIIIKRKSKKQTKLKLKKIIKLS